VVVFALLIGGAGTALTACASGEQRAEDEAVAMMKSELSGMQDTAESVLRSSPDRDNARRAFAGQLDQHVYASSIDGEAITWSLALVGQGGFTTSGNSTVTKLRSCLQVRSAAALQLSLTTVTCPARFTKSPDFETTDREVDLLTR
jgi:hypothetical protein